MLSGFHQGLHHPDIGQEILLDHQWRIDEYPAIPGWHMVYGQRPFCKAWFFRISFLVCYRLLKNMGGLLSFSREKDHVIFTVTLPKYRSGN